MMKSLPRIVILSLLATAIPVDSADIPADGTKTWKITCGDNAWPSEPLENLRIDHPIQIQGARHCDAGPAKMILQAATITLTTSARIILPDGDAGQDLDVLNCGHPMVAGGHGHGAPELHIFADVVDIQGVIELGDGGQGGSVSIGACHSDATAIGGNGGPSSRFFVNGKSTTDNTVGGRGGDGGNAFVRTERGENGTMILEPNGEDATETQPPGITGQHGANATAIGGHGALGATTGGHGGNATAIGGNGGHGASSTSTNRDGQDGGHGGQATAIGGNGGQGTSNGHGGVAYAQSGAGGNGGNALDHETGPSTTFGGKGGNAGAAMARGGQGGLGELSGGDGGNATAIAAQGGNGGNALSRIGQGGAGGTGGQVDATAGSGGDGLSIAGGRGGFAKARSIHAGDGGDGTSLGGAAGMRLSASAIGGDGGNGGLNGGPGGPANSLQGPGGRAGRVIPYNGQDTMAPEIEDHEIPSQEASHLGPGAMAIAMILMAMRRRPGRECLAATTPGT